MSDIRHFATDRDPRSCARAQHPKPKSTNSLTSTASTTGTGPSGSPPPPPEADESEARTASMARSRLKPSFLTSRSTPCCAAWRKATYKREGKGGELRGWGGVRDASERSIIHHPTPRPRPPVSVSRDRLHRTTHLLRPHARLAPEEGGRGREATAAAILAIPSCCCCPHRAPRVLWLWSAPRAPGAATAASCRFHLSRASTALAAPLLGVGCRVLPVDDVGGCVGRRVRKRWFECMGRSKQARPIDLLWEASRPRPTTESSRRSP